MRGEWCSGQGDRQQQQILDCQKKCMHRFLLEDIFSSAPLQAYRVQSQADFQLQVWAGIAINFLVPSSCMHQSYQSIHAICLP